MRAERKPNKLGGSGRSHALWGILRHRHEDTIIPHILDIHIDTVNNLGLLFADQGKPAVQNVAQDGMDAKLML